MKVILFGASGMVGRGVLRECLLDPGVTQVLSVARSEGGPAHEKVVTLVRGDLSDLGPVAADLAGYDACFFCLGVSSSGMDEGSYRRVTYDLTLGAARVLAAENPSMTFVYVSGAGTDSTEKGRTMWARVKGATENALLKLPFRAAYMFRPGLIRPLHGIRSRTASYRVAYAVMAPFWSVAEALLPNQMTTTERVGQAMLAVAETGAPKAVLEARDINALADARGKRERGSVV
jgi:uncharacterized protein YbjT (DUF2867 family)